MQEVVPRLLKKAKQSKCCFRVSAVAFDKRGKVLGYKTNRPFISRYGGSIHAEEALMRRYKNIRTILICRIGIGGILRPISPCKACNANARNRGIEIKSLK